MLGGVHERDDWEAGVTARGGPEELVRLVTQKMLGVTLEAERVRTWSATRTRSQRRSSDGCRQRLPPGARDRDGREPGPGAGAWGRQPPLGEFLNARCQPNAWLGEQPRRFASRRLHGLAHWRAASRTQGVPRPRLLQLRAAGVDGGPACAGALVGAEAARGHRRRADRGVKTGRRRSAYEPWSPP